MAEQLIIAIGREYGSGGHEIAEKLAKRFDIPLYDRNMLDEIAKQKDMDSEELKKYDETPRNLFLSRNVNGFSNSMEEVVASMQFDFLKEKAKNGESFVVVGRCAEDILSEYDCVVSIFIMANMDARIRRIQKIREVSQEEAEIIIHRHDKKRKLYHNYYCQADWGSAKNYSMTLDVSRLGSEKATDVLENFIKIRREIDQ